MVTKFERVMVKLATLGHNPRTLTDCSDVIPVPANTKLPPATLPAGKSLRDIEAAVRSAFVPYASGSTLMFRFFCSRIVPCYPLPGHQGCARPRHHRGPRVRAHTRLLLWYMSLHLPRSPPS